MAHAVAVTRQRQLTPTAGEEVTLKVTLTLDRGPPRASRMMRQADSGAEPLKPTVGDEEALTRDGPRSSRHASEAEGVWVPH